jgi:hypothetical protein
VAVLVLVTVFCFIAGMMACSRWLPDFEDGPIGAAAFFVICGLGGAALALVGIGVDSTIRSLEESKAHALQVLVVSDGLITVLRDAGMIAALALIAYLLAPLAPESFEDDA